jgi:SAM-dependent methyltransferase
VLENKAPQGNPSDQARIVELSDLCTPWALHVVATLRIAEHVAAGVHRIDELAAAADCDPGFLHSVLDHLVRKGVFRQPDPGRFALNGAAKALLDPRLRLPLDLDGFGGRLAYAWGTLLSAVRSGRSAYHEAFGLPFWDDLEAHPEIAASVEDSLRSRTQAQRPDLEVLANDDWSGIHTVVDVGGGTGDLLAEILRNRMGVYGILVDLPRTVGRSAEVFRAAGVADRVSTAGQSFLDPLPARADLYLLRNVLSVCHDDEAITLLSRCAEAAVPAGRVIVLGGVSADVVTNRLSPELVLVGGRERGVPEFERLATTAGLDIVAISSRRSGQLVVECRPSARREPAPA